MESDVAAQGHTIPIPVYGLCEFCIAQSCNTKAIRDVKVNHDVYSEPLTPTVLQQGEPYGRDARTDSVVLDASR